MGETSTKETYDEDNCPTYGLSISQLQTQGYIDGEGNLTSQYDVATANWGGDWRMPTVAELKELGYNCRWTWTTQNGVNGYNVEGPNGNSIFLPAAGYHRGFAGSYGSYWSSTPGSCYDYDAYGLSFEDYGHGMSRFKSTINKENGEKKRVDMDWAGVEYDGHGISSPCRSCGRSVRPVVE